MNDEQPYPEDPVATVAVCYGRTEALVVQSRLADGGITAYLKGEAAASIYGLSVDGLGKIEIVVAAADADAARDILRLRQDE